MELASVSKDKPFGHDEEAAIVSLCLDYPVVLF